MKRKFGIMSECLQGVATKDALPLIKEAGFEAYFTCCYTFDEVEDPTNWEKLRDVDLLDPAAVRRFIEVTHEQYKAKLAYEEEQKRQEE